MLAGELTACDIAGDDPFCLHESLSKQLSAIYSVTYDPCSIKKGLLIGRTKVMYTARCIIISGYVAFNLKVVGDTAKSCLTEAASYPLHWLVSSVKLFMLWHALAPLLMGTLAKLPCSQWVIAQRENLLITRHKGLEPSLPAFCWGRRGEEEG